MTRRNRLLAQIPDNIGGVRVKLSANEVLHTAGQSIAAVYFPDQGYASLVVGTEVGMVGAEGMVGLPLLHGVDVSPVTTIVQDDGSATRLSAASFHHALADLPAFREMLLRYAAAFTAQVQIMAACSARHSLTQRLARRLLMVRERTSGDDIAATQEVSAMMLAVHRPSVTEVTAALRRAGLIEHQRGRVQILDVVGLEEVACGCHRDMIRFS
jgi:CRP-like cAMP-binding protein